MKKIIVSLLALLLIGGFVFWQVNHDTTPTPSETDSESISDTDSNPKKGTANETNNNQTGVFTESRDGTPPEPTDTPPALKGEMTLFQSKLDQVTKILQSQPGGNSESQQRVTELQNMLQNDLMKTLIDEWKQATDDTGKQQALEKMKSLNNLLDELASELAAQTNP
jgi:cytoskeletal protein RodZ